MAYNLFLIMFLRVKIDIGTFLSMLDLDLAQKPLFNFVFLFQEKNTFLF
jgi:hypothetical protein